MLRTAGPSTSVSLLVNTRLRDGCELVMASVKVGVRCGTSRFDMFDMSEQTLHNQMAAASLLRGRYRALASVTLHLHTRVLAQSL